MSRRCDTAAAGFPTCLAVGPGSPDRADRGRRLCRISGGALGRNLSPSRVRQSDGAGAAIIPPPESQGEWTDMGEMRRVPGRGREKSAAAADARAAARQAQRAAAAAASEQLRFIKRKIPVYEILTEEGLALIEENAETVLQEIGIEFRERRGGAAASGRTPAPTSTASACAFPQGPVPRIDPDRAFELRPARPQPGAQRHYRRQ